MLNSLKVINFWIFSENKNFWNRENRKINLEGRKTTASCKLLAIPHTHTKKEIIDNDGNRKNMDNFMLWEQIVNEIYLLLKII